MPVASIKMELLVQWIDDFLIVRLRNPLCPDFLLCLTEFELSADYENELKSDLELIAQGRIDECLI